ncbi:hypothetical protein HMPREF1981_03107 [Bacteroides pyogenes F0041]|uniref:Uncharacterized protein n=1 Tax=Bacteroides pyogenes F0041 TaxID=1321819 RepID=U2DJ81_9BACE|nr:hypothetical protein HMPREF1981_03107 [Bacteroides pyogenes F0041]
MQEIRRRNTCGKIVRTRSRRGIYVKIYWEGIYEKLLLQIAGKE